MTNHCEGGRILGSLGSSDGKGVVRMQERYNSDVDDLTAHIVGRGRGGMQQRWAEPLLDHEIEATNDS